MFKKFFETRSYFFFFLIVLGGGEICVFLFEVAVDGAEIKQAAVSLILSLLLTVVAAFIVLKLLGVWYIEKNETNIDKSV